MTWLPMDRQFHPAGVAVTTEEQAADFIFIFHALRVRFETNHPNMTTLVTDASQAITNGFVTVSCGQSSIKACHILCIKHGDKRKIKKWHLHFPAVSVR